MNRIIRNAPKCIIYVTDASRDFEDSHGVPRLVKVTRGEKSSLSPQF